MKFAILIDWRNLQFFLSSNCQNFRFFFLRLMDKNLDLFIYLFWYKFKKFASHKLTFRRSLLIRRAGHSCTPLFCCIKQLKTFIINYLVLSIILFFINYFSSSLFFLKFYWGLSPNSISIQWVTDIIPTDKRGDVWRGNFYRIDFFRDSVQRYKSFHKIPHAIHKEITPSSNLISPLHLS